MKRIFLVCALVFASAAVGDEPLHPAAIPRTARDPKLVADFEAEYRKQTGDATFTFAALDEDISRIYELTKRVSLEEREQCVRIHLIGRLGKIPARKRKLVYLALLPLCGEGGMMRALLMKELKGLKAQAKWDRAMKDLSYPGGIAPLVLSPGDKRKIAAARSDYETKSMAASKLSTEKSTLERDLESLKNAGFFAGFGSGARINQITDRLRALQLPAERAKKEADAARESLDAILAAADRRAREARDEAAAREERLDAEAFP